MLAQSRSLSCGAGPQSNLTPVGGWTNEWPIYRSVKRPPSVGRLKKTWRTTRRRGFRRSGSGDISSPTAARPSAAVAAPQRLEGVAPVVGRRDLPAATAAAIARASTMRRRRSRRPPRWAAARCWSTAVPAGAIHSAMRGGWSRPRSASWPPGRRELDVTLAIEPMHPGCAGPWTFLTSVGRRPAAAGCGGSAATSKWYSTRTILGQDKRLSRHIAEVVPRTAIVQLGDARRPPKRRAEPLPARRGHRAPGRDRCRAETGRLRWVL